MVFLDRGRGAENIEEKIETEKRKTMINEDKGKQRIQGKQITTMGIFGFTFFIKNYIFLKNIVVQGGKVKSKKFIPSLSFTVFMRCRIFEKQ